MGEGFIGFGHSMDIFAGCDGASLFIVSVDEFGGKSVGHRLAFFASCRGDNPPESKRLLSF
jgi:hypothetical protein